MVPESQGNNIGVRTRGQPEAQGGLALPVEGNARPLPPSISQAVFASFAAALVVPCGDMQIELARYIKTSAHYERTEPVGACRVSLGSHKGSPARQGAEGPFQPLPSPQTLGR